MQKDYQNNLQNILSLIAKHQKNPVTLVGVTKYLTLEETKQAILAGVTNLGENKLQTAEPKILALKNSFPEIKWHYLGRLQSNKIKKIITLFDVIQSVSSWDKLALIEKTCHELNKKIDFLLQLDISGEESKQGLPPDELINHLQLLKNLKYSHFKGIMTMAPYTDDADYLRSIFKSAYSSSQLLIKNNLPCPLLSMGMSNDFLTALEEGSTMVRIGTKLFKEENNNE